MRKLWPIALIFAAACAAPRTLLLKSSMSPPDYSSLDPASRQKQTVRTALLKYYPQLVRDGNAGAGTVLFVTTTSGRIERTDLSRELPPHGKEVDALFRRFPDLRNDPARVGAGVTRFEPGEIGPNPVVVVWTERYAPGGSRGPYRFTTAGPSTH